MTTLTLMLVVSVGNAAPVQTPPPALGAPVQQARPDMVLKWNENALQAIRQDRSSPLVAARNLAIMHLAIYDAVMAFERTHQPYLVDVSAAPGASVEAAAAAAAHRALLSLYPKQREAFDLLYARSLADLPRNSAREQGAAVGVFVAERILEARQKDGIDKADERFRFKTAPGKWEPTPPDFTDALSPSWGGVQPFAIQKATQQRTPGPPAMTSLAYANAFNQVKWLGGKQSAWRTAEQTQIAHFWADDLGTVTPPGHWNKIAQGIARDRGNTLAENARTFAHLNISLADASIVCWIIKFHFEFWRPISGIQNADLDGNPDTHKDASWTPLLNTPPFPAYTSGHSTFSGAAAASLAHSFGGYEVRFTATSDSLSGVKRSFKSLWVAAEEAGMSRIYGGIHWQFDNTDGLKVGHTLGEYVARNTLQPRMRQVTPPTVSYAPLPMMVFWEFPGRFRRLR